MSWRKRAKQHRHKATSVSAQQFWRDRPMARESTFVTPWYGTDEQAFRKARDYDQYEDLTDLPGSRWEEERNEPGLPARLDEVEPGTDSTELEAPGFGD